MFKYISAFILIIITIFFVSKLDIYTNNTIVLGSSLPKTGIMKEWGKSVEIGSNAYFKFVNERKLLPNGRQIKLVTLDDKYEPDLTLENTKKLLERDDLFALYGYVGTPTVKNILHIITETDIPFIAPFTGASFLRDSKYKNIVNFRSSYKEEIQKIINYLYDIKHIEKFAVFYQNDIYGEEGYISLISALKKKNLNLVGEGTYKRNTLSIKHAFKEIKNSKPEAVLMVGSYKANSLFIKRALKDKDLKNVVFCSISFSNANEMINNLNGKKVKNIIFSEVVPSSDNYEIDVINEYKYLMKRYYPKEQLGFISFESFLAAKVTVEALKKANNSLTYKNFLKQIKYNTKDAINGIPLKFNNTELLNKTYLFKYEDNKFIEIEYEEKN
ncbi:ABC transporter substrate-binding protein [Halarcobacter sp.]|uniref:ABC transporter substrate-binding protein n=1 Tax=Halarcobacter sp. TaxID=2321133 RepID=UPI0029F4FCB4|nr:ABC transporter substrate-binding protein [Halarcobacter sp.]